jgi:DNA polymerase-3 subunit delta
MPPLALASVRKQLESGKTDPLYLILGEDEVEKSALARAFGELVEEGLRAFNVERLYGADTAPSEVVRAARTLPMMASRRIVVVLQAEKLLVPRRDTEDARRELEQLEEYFRSPERQTTLVCVAGAVDRRGRAAKLLLQKASVVECGVLRDARDAERWVRAHLDRSGMKVEPAAVRLLVERAGIDLPRLRGDLERAMLYAAGQPRMTADDVRAVVGPATLQDAWAIRSAIERRSAGSALRELALLLDSGAVPYMVLGQLGWIARSALPAARVPAAIEAVFRTDLDLKRSAGDPRVLLERLVVELCGAESPREGRRTGGSSGADAGRKAPPLG